MKVKVVIDRTEIELLPKGIEQGFERYVAPKISGVKAEVFIKPGWKHNNERTANREEG